MAPRGRGGRNPRAGRPPFSPRGRGRGGFRGNASRANHNGSGQNHNRSENTHEHLYSMREEARNTEAHHDHWKNATDLRHSSIAFVAAGHLEPRELLEAAEESEEEVQTEMDLEVELSPEVTAEDGEDAMDLDKLDLNAEVEFVVDVVGDPALAPNAEQATPSSALDGIKEEEEQTGFVLDLVGDPTLAPKPTPISIRARSPSIHSNSSDEILFKPRGFKQVASSDVPETLIVQEQTTITSAPITTAPTEVINLDYSFTPLIDSRKRRKTKQRKQKQERTRDPAIQDYIDNVAASMMEESEQDITTPFNPNTELGGSEWIDSSTDSDDEASDAEAIERYANGWDSDTIAEAFDTHSTDSDTPGVIDQVLGKRKRPSGTQYLVKWEDHDIEDASWVLAEKLDSAAIDKLRRWEMRKSSVPAPSSSSDEDEEMAEHNQEEEDRKLAELLQSIEDGSDNGMDTDPMYSESAFITADTFIPLTKKRKKRQPFVPDISPSNGVFPSASATADAYESLAMGWDRPSIAAGKKKKKGKEKAFDFNLSDSELEEQLQASFMKDREKKKMRKQDREVLRREGLLGKGANGKQDLRVKYEEGMSMENIITEIRKFMMSTSTELKLPAMTKASRKSVHTLSSHFALKSKSVGSGHQRYPTLYKTARSTLFEFDEEGIDGILSGKSRFLGGARARGGGRGGRGGGGGNGGGQRHREGDVVGGDAPEIDGENKGRKMLEKMGYRSGMTLGKVGGEGGIMEPVRAVVKISKAGLG